MLHVLVKICVTELALDAFEVDAQGLTPSQRLSALEVAKEFVHCFAQREYGVRSLSLKRVELEAADSDGIDLLRHSAAGSTTRPWDE